MGEGTGWALLKVAMQDARFSELPRPMPRHSQSAPFCNFDYVSGMDEACAEGVGARSASGDLVVITYTEALAISVEKIKKK